MLLQTSTKMGSRQLKFMFWLLAGSAVCGCSGAERSLGQGIVRLGMLAHPKITESSGLVASRQYTNVFWTHTDGGKNDTLYAVSREGRTLGEFKVTGAKFDDWEDIAIDDQRQLYLADTGDNDAKRKQVRVYRVEEPNPASAGPVRPNQEWKLRWPEGPVDSEGLFIYGTDGYLVTKVKNNRTATLYRFNLNPAGTQFLELAARLSIDSPVTGADIAPNGAAVAFVSGDGAYVYRIDGDVSKLARVQPYFARFKHDSIEGCTFVREGLLTTAESRELILFTAEPFRVLP
jgi:hypothetical protein